MTVNNRRNALLGFVVWTLAKRTLRRRVRTRRGMVALGASGAALGALVGGLVWARRGHGAA